MNCNNFETAVGDLARGAMMDAAARAEALAHAQACARCGARLSDERALTEGLRSLSAQTSALEAPARVEAALLAAFRGRAAAGNTSDAAAATTTAVVPLASRRRAAWRLPMWAQGAAVAAASVVLVFGLYVALRGGAGDTPGARADRAGAHAPTGSAAPAPTQAPTAHDLAAIDTPRGSFVQGLPGGEAPRTARGPARTTAAKVSYRPAADRYPSGLTAPAPPAEAADEEVMTEFIPLMSGGQLATGEAAHLMRVEVPRTALASFGLPVNADSPAGRVKADVLVGEDGIARAIRFVR